ncbi:MAG: CCA tRNA nucleotidyltransferase [Solirubrobacterales bacterium]|nr:CCA tRNA nucleotidyltransferase [Solirubrobacterales bacterium]
MDIPSPDELLDRLRRLPAGRTLLERIPAGAGVFLVGGAVRDLLLGRDPTELDLVVEGDALALARQLGGSVLANDRFGTSTVRLDGHRYDIATARRETYARPGALPDVTPAALAEDLRRRDFTVNTVAMALGGERAGRLVAVPGALDDLKQRMLRVLHDASFIDDPTRLLRVARYAGRLGFALELHTRELAQAAVRAGALETVSGPRIGSELRLLARERHPLAAFAVLGELGLDRAIDARFGLRDPEPARRALQLLPSDGRADLLVVAAAAERVPRADLVDLLDRLAFEASDRVRIVAAATEAKALAPKLVAARTPAEIAAAAHAAPPELVALAGGHGDGEAASAWLGRLRHVRLEIDGGDLLAAGVPEGPLIGRGLRAALDAKLDGRVAGREAELAEALEAVR